MKQAELVSESRLRLVLAEEIAVANIARLQQAEAYMQQAMGDTFLESIIAYNSLLVSFDPLRILPAQALLIAQSCVDTLADVVVEQANARCIELPVYYHPSVAADLAPLAAVKQCTVDDIIHWHSSTVYRVFALGFSPGFAFMGELPEPLRIARHATPRSKVVAGSVAIAERQTAVYPSATPGGWHIIGRCPTRLFDPQKTPSALLQAGDAVRFCPIDQQTFIALGGVLDE